ncbi:MAG: GTPase HflX [Actinobacteria bacterium]|nr:GTPase HflX [Actinomycetota bacterium]
MHAHPRSKRPAMSSGQQGRGRRRLTASEVDLEVIRQRALLVGTGIGTRSVEVAEESLAELARLTDTAGADAVEIVLQRRDHPDSRTYIGKGKAEELRESVKALDIDVVIFDDELSPAQQRNLEKIFEVDVVDRVALILDIFAQHAASQEGMLQVELAQLRYQMPRLRGRGGVLSQQGGGIGTRGPGETQLEVDRRRIQRRVARLERDLSELVRKRGTQRKARMKIPMPNVALVGYTNAGKSTVLNRITEAHVLVENRLFSTLDPTTRRLRLSGGEIVLVSDTVGFVRRLPHQLVEAFRSTLEEVADADLLLHIVDAGAADIIGQVAAVRAVLAEVGATDLPEFMVINKIDTVDEATIAEVRRMLPDATPVSALTGEGIPDLLQLIATQLRSVSNIVELGVPYARGDVLASLHREGEVLVEVHEADQVRVQVRISEAAAGRFAEFRIT